MPNEDAFTQGLAEDGSPAFTQIDPPAHPPVQPATRTFTEDDLAKARAQEKDKLYPQLERLQAENAAFKKAEEERAAAEAQRAAEAAEAERKRQEDEMDVRTLLQKKEQEWEAQLKAEQTAREQAFLLLEQERRYQDLQNYRAARLDEARESIIPDLLDFVDGNTPEEIDASIARLQEKSSRIFEASAAATQAARQNMVGTRVTSPAAGPLDTESGHKSFSLEDVSNMSMSEYAKNRNALLGQVAQGRSRGLFG